MFLQGKATSSPTAIPMPLIRYGELIKKYPNTRHLNVVGARQFARRPVLARLDHAHHRPALVPNLIDHTQP